MEKWNQEEVQVLVSLLKDYADRLSNDGCNDLSLNEQKLADLLNVGRDEDDEITSNWQLVDYFKSKIKKVSFSEQSSSSDLEVAKIKALETQVKSLTEKNLSLSKKVSQLEKVQDMINQIKNLK